MNFLPSAKSTACLDRSKKALEEVFADIVVIVDVAMYTLYSWGDRLPVKNYDRNFAAIIAG
ncbi:MAG: hypothetical protein COW05_09305 [Gammaproteobacteria bacterium CG12_big_fil_rev_8_21_14_0_65_46_12]|nr:MAG: hypothetical protein COW05_09305 [Gammaproteobacteria bacterium CG12_big_fil_rev_8_21_14_0_65_46_12]